MMFDSFELPKRRATGRWFDQAGIGVSRGLTLVELMIALAIISLLAGISLPTVKTMIEGQRISRAGALVQTVIQEGRARSISRGGGGGILIERIGNENIYERCQSIRVRFVDAPSVYTGDSNNATVRYRNLINPLHLDEPGRDFHIVLFDPEQSQILRSATDYANTTDDKNVSTLINIGSTIRLGDQGLPMTIVNYLALGSGAPWGNTWARPGEARPPGFATGWVAAVLQPQEPGTNLRRQNLRDLSFSITKSPRPAIAMPLDLPVGTAIDLTASGIGRYGNDFSPMQIGNNYMDDSAAPFDNVSIDYGSIMILFGARGEVSRVLSWQWVVDPNGDGDLSDSGPIFGDIPVTGDIHLLVGEAGQVKPFPEEQLEDNDPNPLEDEAEDGITPLLNPDSIWVTIKARSGEVVTSSWADPTDPDTALVPPPEGSPDSDAQRLARIRRLIGLTRDNAISTRDTGSL